MQSDGTMSWYEYQKMQHRCTACAQKDAYTMAGRALCADCSARNNERMRVSYKKDPSKKREAQRERCDRLRADGICIQCGSRPVEDTLHSRCRICRSLNFRRWRKKSRKNSRDTANQCGLCYKCFKPLEDGEEKMCRECRDKVLKFSKTGRESQGDKIGSEWRKSW